MGPPAHAEDQWHTPDSPAHLPPNLRHSTTERLWSLPSAALFILRRAHARRSYQQPLPYPTDRPKRPASALARHRETWWTVTYGKGFENVGVLRHLACATQQDKSRER